MLRPGAENLHLIVQANDLNGGRTTLSDIWWDRQEFAQPVPISECHAWDIQLHTVSNGPVDPHLCVLESQRDAHPCART